MAVKDSKLSEIGVDMAVAVRQTALNTQLRAYLSQAKAEYRAYFVWFAPTNKGADYVIVDANTKDGEVFAWADEEMADLLKEIKSGGLTAFRYLENLKIFEAESATYSAAKLPSDLRNAAALGLQFCFHVEDGIPQSIRDKLDENAINGRPVNDDDICRIVQIQDANKRVNYSQFFKEFKIVEFKSTLTKVTLTKIQQDPQDPFVFLYDIPLDFVNEGNFSALQDPVVKQRFLDMVGLDSETDAENLFEISSLSLILERMATIQLPNIDGISAAAKGKINETVIPAYFDRLKQTGQTAFAYVPSFKPSSGSHNYIFTPKSRTFATRSQGGSNQAALIYLVQFDDRRFPANRVPTWDYFGKGDKNDGVMSINRDKILWKLIEEFRREVLPQLRIKVSCSTSCKVYGDMKYSCSFSLKDTPDSGLFQLDGQAKYVYPSYSDSSCSDMMYLWAPPLPFPIASGKLGIDYSFDCWVVSETHNFSGLNLPALKFSANVKGHIKLWFDSQCNEGTFYDHRIDFYLGIALSDKGEILFEKEIVNTDNNPKGVDIGGWSKFMSAWQIKSMVSKFTSDLGKSIDGFESQANSSFNQMFNWCVGWVIPGKKTFAFTDESFSDNLDFCSLVNYTDSSDGI